MGEAKGGDIKRSDVKRKTIGLLRSVTTADPADREFGNTVQIQLKNKAKARGVELDVHLLDFDEIFREGIISVYGLE